MLRNTVRRRWVSGALLVAGGILVWAVTPSAIGLVLLVLGVALEIAGIVVEHRSSP